MTPLEEALAAIPARRNKLNALDDRLVQVIRHVETVLFERLKVLTPCEVTYDTEDGRFILGYGKSSARWQLLWGRAEDDDSGKDIPLMSAPRLARAEVFVVNASGQCPMERLLVEAAESLAYYADERAPQLETANRLLKTLADAGFPLVA